MFKIFCVGYPRSGTTSLNSALNMLNIKSTHNNELSKKYDAYTNFVWTFFKRLDKNHPDALFICTYRDPSEIAISCIRHWYKNLDDDFYSNYKNIITNATNHYNKVFKYFSDKQDRFLILRICDGDGWEKLCPFLGMSIPNRKFPKTNISTNIIRNQRTKTIGFI